MHIYIYNACHLVVGSIHQKLIFQILTYFSKLKFQIIIYTINWNFNFEGRKIEN